MSIDETGFFSYIYSSWLTKYLWKAYRKGITLSDIPEISPLDTCSSNLQKFENLWNDELRRRGPTSASLTLVSWRFVQFRVLIACILNTSSQIVNFIMQAVLLRKLLEYSEGTDTNFFWGMHWVIYIIGFDLLQMILYTWGDIMNKRTALRLKSACLSLLFKKIINLNSIAHKNADELTDILSKEDHKIYEAVNVGVTLLSAPIATIGTLICVLMWLKSSALIGVSIFIIFYKIQYWLVHLIDYCKQNAQELTEARINKTFEVMEKIRLIKIYGWEQHFIQNILNIRNREAKWLWKLSYIKSFNNATADAMPIISIIMMFFMHLVNRQDLSASLVFPICILFTVQMHGSFRKLKSSLHKLQETKNVFLRIKGGLLMEDTSCHITKPYEASQAVAIFNGTFVYDIFKKQKHESEILKNDRKNSYVDDKTVTKAEKQRLKTPTLEPKRLEILTNITFKARKGQLIGISGKSNSGKSSLLLAALGQMKMTSGQLMRQGSCAYVGQQAWLSNGTIRENILFEEAYDEKRYFETQIVCKLRQDVKNLPMGDNTEIGHDGIEVSESVKQKIALARAFYADRDIYFLDDPLIGMEDKVKDEIFEDLIVRALGEKTILLVTDELEYLDRCDYMYIMRDGKIAEHGRHKELMRLGKEYAAMVKAVFDEDDYDGYSDESHDNHTTKEIIRVERKVRQTIQLKSNTENSYKTEEVNPKTYYKYAKTYGGYFLISLVILVYIVYAGVQIASLLRLSLWIDDIEKYSDRVLFNYTHVYEFHKKWYGLCFFLVIICCIIQSLVVQFATNKIANNLHDALLKKLMQSPMKFFDYYANKIKTLFVHDLDNVSHSLPLRLDNALRYIFLGFFTFFVLISTIQWFSNYVILISIIIFFVVKIYRVALTDVTRLENLQKQTIDRFLHNSLEGLSTIRTFKKENDLLSKFEDLIDGNSACYFIKGIIEKWLSIRLQILMTTCIFVAGSLIVIMKGNISPSIAGLTFVYVFQVPYIIITAIRYVTKMETNFVSVQNICNAHQKLDNERDAKIISIMPHPEWPVTGKIMFDSVQLKYIDNSKPALDNVTLSVNDCEKIGIINNIEISNSPFISAMYRLYELNNGKISIDETDISDIDVKLLRSKLSIIPEHPIFYNTIRFFLDPDKRHSDAELWNALEKVHLKDKIASAPSQLHYTIDEKIFSSTEKQLLFLARTILTSNKIIFVEECNVEAVETSMLLQIIEKECPNSTLIIIIRRLRTALTCDRVIVMDDGKILEFDKPSILLANENSHLSQMAAKDNEINRRL